MPARFFPEVPMNTRSHCGAPVDHAECSAVRGEVDRCRAADKAFPVALELERSERLAELAGFRAKEFARLCGVSLRTLQRQFQRLLRQTPQRWLYERRLIAVQRLLLGGCSENEAALKLGFKHLSHLCRQFKIRYHLTPLEFVVLSRGGGRVSLGDNCVSPPDNRVSLPDNDLDPETKRSLVVTISAGGPSPGATQNCQPDASHSLRTIGGTDAPDGLQANLNLPGVLSSRPDRENRPLTTRENEVLGLQAEGLLYKEIADRLHIKQGTVNNHLYAIRQKLGVHNGIEAINAAPRPAA